MCFVPSCKTGKKPDDKTFIDIDEFKRAVLIEVKHERKDSLSIDQCLYLIKMYNSINFFMINDSTCNEFQRIFDNNYKNTVIIKVDLNWTGGWAYYSKKYNIFFGGNLYTREGLVNFLNAPSQGKMLYDQLSGQQ
jgi:hypothetical protein